MARPGRDGGEPALHVVLNASAGSRGAEALRGVVAEVLDGAGRAHEIHVAPAADRLAATARQAVDAAAAAGGIVVAAGGDGTINTVAQAVLGSGCAVGVLPHGTFNYFARTHGIPTDTVEATRVLLDGEVRPVQVGLLNDRVFLVNASLGLYPKLLEDREAYKKQYGRSRLVAICAGLASFVRHHRQLRLVIEQEARPTRTLRTPTVFVGNNRLQLEQIGLAEAQAVEAGRLVVLTLKPTGSLHMLWLLARGAFGRLGEAEQVNTFTTAAMSISSGSLARRRRIKVATDGEVAWLDGPLRFRISPEPLRLLVPKGSR